MSQNLMKFKWLFIHLYACMHCKYTHEQESLKTADIDFQIQSAIDIDKGSRIENSSQI